MKLTDIIVEAAQQQTYSGWKAACRRAFPGCTFRGDKDIGAAVLDGKDVGEWDGAVGEVFKHLKESQSNADKLKELRAELKLMPSNPQTQAEYDMIDDLLDEIDKLKKLVAAEK